MLYFKNRPFCFERNNATIYEIKTLAKLLPVIGNHIYDPNDPEAQLADSDFAYFKNTSNDSTNKILQFITKRISHEELKAIIDANAPDLTISDDYISSKSFTITYKGKEIPCSWSGGPGGTANTNIQTELKEYATQVAIELGPRNMDDPDAIKKITDAINFILSKSKNKSYKPDFKLIRSYVDSAISTSNKLYSDLGLDSTRFDFELQCKGSRSKLIYDKARSLGASNKDNWNPADIWGFAKDLTIDKIENAIHGYTSIIQLNDYINEMMGATGNMKASNMRIIPISLKKISDPKNMKVSRMDSDKRNKLIADFLNDKDLYIDNIHFSDELRQLYIILSNGAKIHVRNTNGGVGPTRWELSKIRSTARDGNIDKNLITKYVFESQKETDIQNRYFISGKDATKDDAILNSFEVLINKMYRLPDHVLLKTDKVTINRLIDGIYSNIYGASQKGNIADNIKWLNTIIVEVIACYYAIKNIPDIILDDDRTLLQKMYLSGMKIDDGQCSYIKVHQ